MQKGTTLRQEDAPFQTLEMENYIPHVSLWTAHLLMHARIHALVPTCKHAFTQYLL